MAEPDPRSDEALARAANGGDEAAFESLYRRHRDWVVALAYRLTGSHADALDVLQDTFAYLLGKLPRLRLSASMTTFLYPVVKHLSIRARRKSRRHLTGADDVLAEAEAPQAPPPARQELAAVLRVLPEAQREVLLMRFVDEMALREIAEALRVPTGTVKSRLHNALRTLRNDERTRRYFLE